MRTKRPYDASQARCDTCGKPYVEGEGLYAIANKFDESIEDRDVLISFRHWKCHKSPAELLDELRGKIKEAEGIVRRLKR